MAKKKKKENYVLDEKDSAIVFTSNGEIITVITDTDEELSDEGSYNALLLCAITNLLCGDNKTFDKLIDKEINKIIKDMSKYGFLKNE